MARSEEEGHRILGSAPTIGPVLPPATTGTKAVQFLRTQADVWVQIGPTNEFWRTEKRAGLGLHDVCMSSNLGLSLTRRRTKIGRNRGSRGRTRPIWTEVSQGLTNHAPSSTHSGHKRCAANSDRSWSGIEPSLPDFGQGWPEIGQMLLNLGQSHRNMARNRPEPV